MEFSALCAYLVIGGLSGVLGGLLGISGGLITVPCLFFIFKNLPFPQDHLMHFAIGTSLAAMIFNALSATFFHHLKKGVLWGVVQKMALGVILGSLTGALMANVLPGAFLRIFFGFFACGSAFYFFKPSTPSLQDERLPGALTLNLLGFGVSFLANILGIGGGIIILPILIAYKVSDKKAIGTSSAITLLITTLGAVSYLIFGLQLAHFKDSFGFIYLPAFCVIALTTFLVAPLGVRLSQILPSLLLRRLFACALISTGIIMIIY